MTVTSPLIELRGAEKVYRTGRLEYAALREGLTWRSGLGDSSRRRAVREREDDRS